MNKIFELCSELLDVAELDNLVSKVDGRKNYMIRIDMYNEKYEITYAGTAGNGKWFRTEIVSFIQTHHTRWFFYTFKKDYKKTLEILNALGIE